jgi:hypothetical protein
MFEFKMKISASSILLLLLLQMKDILEPFRDFLQDEQSKKVQYAHTKHPGRGCFNLS